jgi:hypothetical protein
MKKLKAPNKFLSKKKSRTRQINNQLKEMGNKVFEQSFALIKQNYKAQISECYFKINRLTI